MQRRLPFTARFIDVPLAASSGNTDTVEIPEEDVPLAATPRTGDSSAVWYVSALISLLSLALVLVNTKEREND